MFVKKKQKIRVRMFFELMGWPKEALNKSLKDIVNKLRQTINVTDEKYAEPEKISEKMYTSHVEFEAEIKNVRDVFMITISFGPSVVEILDPAEIIITAGEFQDILADISAKVNTMDKDIKILAARLKQATDVLKRLKIVPKKEKEAENKQIEDNPNFTIKK